MTISRMCPTCRNRQDFRKLDDAEQAAVRKEKGERHYVHDLWRCTAEGCRWYQPYLHTAGGGLLPERFGKQAAADG
ncbi:hypothetical protein ACIQAC_37310 [Streptomyces sp. NPDC088387]|uniref:hypothetical protein n=1 Tax=Streptomyces sp. NPDC088387 TaxID=3365859 RepID=UPI003811CE24